MRGRRGFPYGFQGTQSRGYPLQPFKNGFYGYPRIAAAAAAGQDIVGVNTTTDGKQVIYWFGDSNVDGRGETIPTVAPGILYKWDGTENLPITTQSLANDAGHSDKGGMQQQFATDYKALTGYSTIALMSSHGGSTLADWALNGSEDLYQVYHESLINCLTFNKIKQPRYIVVNLGLNDIGGSIVNFTNNLTTVIRKLTTDWPQVQIIYVQVGRGSTTVSQSFYDVRNAIVAKVEATKRLFMCGIPASFVGAGFMQGDNLHFTQAGYNALGSMLVRWVSNSAFDNKWSRCLISSHFDELSTLRKGLVDQFVKKLYIRGDFFKLESLHFFKTTTQNNIYIDWALLGFISGAPSAFTANSHTSSNGTTTNFTWSFIPLYNNRAAAQDNFRAYVKLKDRTSSDVTACALFGVNDGTSQFDIRQSGAGVVSYKANDTTASAGTDPNLQDNVWYGVARQTGNKYLYKRNVQDATAAVPLVSMAAGVAPRIAAYNNNGTIADRIAGQFEAVIAAPDSGFDWAATFDDLDTLLTNW